MSGRKRSGWNCSQLCGVSGRGEKRDPSRLSQSLDTPTPASEAGSLLRINTDLDRSTQRSSVGKACPYCLFHTQQRLQPSLINRAAPSSKVKAASVSFSSLTGPNFFSSCSAVKVPFHFMHEDSCRPAPCYSLTYRKHLSVAVFTRGKPFHRM